MTPAPRTYRFWPRQFEKGAYVIAQGKYRGHIDGMTKQGTYVVVFDWPVCFPTLGIKVERASFDVRSLEEIK